MRPTLLAIAALSSVVRVGGCYPSSAPPPGSHQLNVQFQHWINSGYCSAAVTSMWIRFSGTQYPSSQQDIVNWGWQEYWWEMGADNSFSPWLIRQVLWDYSFIDTRDDFYVGEAEKRQAVADIKKGINLGRPTIVITHSQLHTMLVKGGTWNQLPNYQPEIEYITTADPELYGFRNDTVGYWVQNVGAGDAGGTYIRTIATVGQRYSAADELAEFDYWGGTYYGEEDPPDGCTECVPMLAAQQSSLFRALWTFFARPQGQRMAINRLEPSTIATRRKIQQRRPVVGPEYRANHAVRRFTYVPKPNASATADVIENLMAGMHQTNLRSAEDWGDLDELLSQRRISVVSVDPIASLSGFEDYWLLTSAADQQPFAQALVSKVGWLLSVWRPWNGSTIARPRSLSWAREIADELGYVQAGIRRVHMLNNLTPQSASSDYDPFFEVSLAGRQTAFVAQNGNAFIEEANGPGTAIWQDGRRRFTRIR